MADNNRGQHPNSKANLLQGSNLPKLNNIDTETVRMANRAMNEETEYQGVKMTIREAILRVQMDKALDGDLRSCQFLIELAGRNEGNVETINGATATPLEQLQAMMQPSRVIDRRKICH